MKNEYSIMSTYSEPQTKSKAEVSDLVSPTMPTLQIAALVEGCHWFISRSSLNLHKVGPWVLTFWARFFKKKKKKKEKVLHLKPNQEGLKTFI